MLLSADEILPSRPWKSITFTSSDGASIQGWLGLPDGEGPFPTILETHGGPEGVTTEEFDPASQCWLDHGFAFLSINYHGSITLGREFQEKIRGNIGQWELEDMVAARNWLMEQGVARPDQIFVTGWSYGGYLTLFALGKRPELWAGGMAGVAFGDYVVAYEDEAEMLKAYDRGLMGGTPQEKPEQYKASSPITYAVEQAVAAIDSFLKRGLTVAVHCFAGLGRTGTVLACYLVSQGMAAEKAISSIRSQQPGSIETYEQEAVIALYERRLTCSG